eukprot:6470818-Amphidinium_carterae.1
MAPKKKNALESEHVDVLACIRKFGKVGDALDRRELSLLFVCYDVCQRFMLDVAAEFVQCHGAKPILMQYSQDCMASKLRQHISAKAGSLKVRRSGIQAEELLVQNIFLTAEVNAGKFGHCALFGAPLKCVFGKDGAALAGYSTAQLGLNVLTCNPVCFRLRHFVLDRGVPSDVPMFLSAHILEQSCAPTEEDDESDDEDATPHLTELHTSVSCACHDGHNAVKWAAHGDFSSEQRMTSIYIACSAMRTGFMKCFAMLAAWIRQVLEPVSCERLPSTESLKSLWSVLQVPEASMEVMLQLRLFWSGSSLFIDEEALTDPDWLETLTTLLMTIWRLPSWTASRWLTIGASCRSYTIACLTGFENMFSFLNETSTVSAYDQTGYERLDAGAKDFLVVTSLVSYTSESFLASILCDNRLAMRSEEVHQLCMQTHGFLETIDGWVWDQISTVTGQLSASALRSRVVRGSLSSLAYLEHRVFTVVRKGPWCYCSGDVKGHAEALKHLSLDECDPVTRKLVIWAQAGIDETKLQEVLKLLGQCSFSSHFAERQHSSSAQMKKYHDYGYETLAVRSYMHSFCQLVSKQTGLSGDVLRLQRELASLLSKQPQKAGAKQMYFAEMVSKGRALQNRGKITENREPQKTAMKHHSKHFQALSEEDKQRFGEQAIIHQSASSMSVNKRARDVDEKLGEARAKALKAESQNESSMLLSACRLSWSQFSDPNSMR